MSDSDSARTLALALPEATEQDHHGFPSFRVGGRIFATMPDEEHLNVMLREDTAREALSMYADCSEELWWGKTLAGVRVTLAAIGDDVLEELLAAAWRRRAPKKLLDE